MFSLSRFKNGFRTSNKRRRPAAAPFRPAVEALEERCTPTSGMSSIAANFNNTAIAPGSSVWFSSVFKAPGGLGSSPVTLQVTNQTITFSAAGTSYNVSVPDASVTLDPKATSATTTFDPVANQWVTNLPAAFKGNAFLDGVILAAPSGLPGGIHPVTWQGQFTSSVAGITVSWQWGAAVYTSFSGDYSTLNVKPCDDPHLSAYQNNDHAGTPEAYKTAVTAGATGGGGTNYTGNLAPGASVVTVVTGSALLYPFPSSNPLTSIAFNESDVLAAAKLDVANGTFEIWYTDEHALSLGVRQVNVKTSSGTTTTNYPIAPLTSDPGTALNPAIGTTAATGDQAGTDTSGRPIAPMLYITDTTSAPNSLSGDWQYGGSGFAPGAVFGAWKGAVRTVDHTTSPATVTVVCDVDPARNAWNLGAGSDNPPAGTANAGYGAEVLWNLNDLYAQGVLIPGHTYRFYVMVHDGDQNKAGGDSGQAAFNYFYPGPPNYSPPATIAGFVTDTSSGTPLAVAGVLVTLTGTTASGQYVTLTTTTAADGSYSFANLQAGTYSLSDTPLPNYFNVATTAGTVGGSTDGSVPALGTIASITLNPGDNGIQYDFVLGFSGGTS